MTSTLTLQRNGNQTKPTRTSWQTTYTPVADIFEGEDELRLYLDLPGVRPEDVELRFERNELTVHGRVAPRQHEENVLAEYDTREFHRAFRISEEVDPDQISATLKDGVLTLRLPKSDRVKPRKISVRGAE